MRTIRATVAGAVVALAALLGASTPAAADDWKPSQPIHVIVPYQPVGTSDIISRAMGERMTARLGQPFVVENRAGGSTQIGTAAVVNAKPDGHTVLIVANTFAVNPSLFSKLPYDSLKDLAPITYAGVTPHTLVVHPSLPVHNLKELLDYARANPDKLSYGSVGNGTSFHLGMEELKKRSGTSIVHVPYKGMGPVLADLLGNNIQVAFANTPNIVQHVQAGKLRAIAVAHPKRVPQLPDVPTVAEQGFPGFESNSWFVYLAPGATPPRILDSLNRAFVDVLNEPEVRKNLTEQGVEVMATSREETAAFIRREMAKYAELVKFSGAKVD
jgi:tripartite-type tricarboxylate transporter receptor subunit TctC